MSQGIESTIDYAEDRQSWSLVVDQKDLNKALRTRDIIRLRTGIGLHGSNRCHGRECISTGQHDLGTVVDCFYVVSTGNPGNSTRRMAGHQSSF